MRSKKSSYADLLRDWQELLDRCGEQLPDLDLERSPLLEALREMQELRTFQRYLGGTRQRVTERLGEVRESGWESAQRLRGLLTWKLGMRKAPGSRRSRVETSPEGSERSRTMRESTRSGMFGEWQRLQTAMQVNGPELTHLETQRAQFDILLGQTDDLFQAQAAFAASKQKASQELAALVSECQRLATVLRFSLKLHYGPRSEKLVEFGIQPFRSRTPAPKLPPPPIESTAPADSTPAVD
jgi:hypothetical protein